MFLLFGDEADHDGREGAKFFLYSAIFIPSHSASSIDSGVKRIREKFGFQQNDSLKFAKSACPSHIDKTSHTAAKEEIIALAKDSGVKFCSYVILNDLAKAQEHDIRIQWAVNTILDAFNKFLNQQNSYGIALFDRLPVKDKYAYFKGWYQNGLDFNGHYSPLKRILAYSSTCDGASSFSSMSDILLGSFRYCVNEENKDIVGKKMLPKVVDMMWNNTHEGKKIIREYGLLLRPKNKVTSEKYKGEYDNLIQRLNDWLKQNN